MPPIKLPNGSKTVTEIDVGTRFKGVTVLVAASSSVSLAIPA